jgi:type II secretory pathway component PulJ
MTISAQPPATSGPGHRSGMTLVEMLVATAATLMLMGAIAQVFSVFGSAVTNSRSMIELDGRMRAVAWKLRSDLSGATARTLPPLDTASGAGYFEIVEGPLNDNNAASGSTTLDADTDDVLLFTTRSADQPFLGKSGSAMIESSTAEVAWFLRPTGTTPPTYTLYRRQLLVVGYAGFGPFAASGNNTTGFTAWNTFYDDYDISVRREGAVFVPNTLADLTRRESRFMHNPTGITNGSGFPYALNAVTGYYFDSSSSRIGEDVVLTNVLAFDVRVFDPAAPVGVTGNDAQVPGDPGLGAAVTNGGYVDLGNGNSTPGPSGIAPHFSGTGQRNYRLQSGGMAGLRTWDTWSTHYETNGVDDDGVYGADQGSDGLDNDNDGFVDESDEQETSPPYPYPLRGIEIRIRCYEPSSRQVRQTTVRHTFVPH